MTKRLQFILIVTIGLFYSNSALALNIQYGSILGFKGDQALVQYYEIEIKNNFLCSFSNGICAKTTRKTFGSIPSTSPSQKTRNSLEKIHADYITLSPYKNLLAYYFGPTPTKPERTFVVQNLNTKKKYTTPIENTNWDLISDKVKLFDFLPDKKTVLYLDDKDGAAAIYSADTTKSIKGVLSGVKLPTNAYVINNFLVYNSKTLYYIGNTETNPYIWSLYKYNFSTKQETKIDDFISQTGPLYKNGNYIIYEHLEANGYGPKIYNTSTGSLSVFQIPGINAKENISNEEIININGTYSILMKPENVNGQISYPLLIWLHGGPYRQNGYGYDSFHSYGIYDSILDLIKNNNTLVLKLDYHGSSGFGRAYSESIKDNVGIADVNDVVNAVNNLKTKYNISNVYLAGNSYGGYLALKSLVEHPELFTSVMSINGVTDWQSLLIKLGTSIFNVHFNGLPNSSNQYIYDQASIINKIQNLGGQKIYIVQGQSDTTIPPWQATFLVDKLKAQNKNITFIPYLNENHVFKYKKNIDDLCTKFFALMDKVPDPECLK